MTLNTGNGVSPPIHRQQSSHSPQSPPGRRRNTVGSPTSAVFTPSASAHLALPRPPPQLTLPQFLPLLSPGQGPLLQTNGYFTGTGPHLRSPSPSAKSASPNRRRQASRSPERGPDQTQGTAGAWLSNGRKSTRQQPPSSKSAASNMPAKKDDVRQHSIAAPRPSFKTHRSNISTQSNSLPSTPNHHPRNLNGASRSPSPSSCMLDSPRSAASEPVTNSQPKPRSSGCIYETALIGARRRMPYSLGIDKLNTEKPKLDRLAPADEKKLTQSIMELYEKLRPSEASEQRKRKFLNNLNDMLNQEWPGHDIQVHAFGSTENHLCMKDSDVDVCITTSWNGLSRTCDIARALGKRGMERVVCVPGAKVPIVKIWDPVYEVACDMNVNGTLALDNTRMIKTYVEIDPRVRPLALIVKHWTKQRCLNDAAGGGTLSSYTWICMILNFLQTRDPPVLPALHMRPHKKKPPINGVDASFDDDIESLRGFGEKNTETVGELLFGFFKTYGHELDYEQKVISVRTGTLLSKDEKNWKWLQNNRLCVEEPFNIDRNLGNTADDCSMRGIHLEFRRAHKILSETADLAECCERYEFPPEETHHFVPSQPPSRPVTMSRSNSNHGRRNGYSNGNRGGRGYNWNNRQNQNRRASSSAAYNNFVQQQQQQQQQQQHPQFYPPELFGYMAATPQEQLLALQAQIHAQAQFAHAAQVHAQMQGQQTQTQSAAQNNPVPSSAPPTGSTNPQDPLVPFHHLASWPYFAHLYGMQMFYPSLTMSHEPVPGTASPPSTLVSDSRHDSRHDRLGLGRGTGRAGAHNSSPRSHSQPPPLYPVGNYANPWMRNPGIPPSEDDDYGDHSSNGNPPETPPAEQPDEYVGYYSIGDALQSDLAVVDVAEGEESFVEQKSMVDRQKRYSHEKLPPPMLGPSRDTSPVPVNRKRHNRDNPPPHLSLDDQSSSDSFLEDRGPVIVNGAVPLSSASSYSSAMYSKNSPPGEGVFAYEVPVMNGVRSSSMDVGSDTSANGSFGHQQELFAQKLLELHSQAARSDGAPSGLNSPASTHYSTQPSTNDVSHAMTQMASLSLDEDLEDALSPKLSSPNLRQRAATQQILWTNSRAASVDNKARGYNSSQEDLALPLTPVPEARTPSPTSTRKDSEAGQSTNTHKPAVNGTKAPAKSESVPPTPGPVEKHGHEKNGHKNGGKSKTSGKGASGQHSNKSGQDSKSEHKSGSEKRWKQQKSKQAKKGKSGQKHDAAVSSNGSLNGSERKGG